MTSTLADWACCYSASGFVPIRVCANGKIPVDAGWQHTRYSDDQLRQLFYGYQGNIGLTFPDDLFALDIDQKNGKDGLAQIAAMESELGLLPATLTAMTPTGGQHRLFRLPPGVVLKNSVAVRPGVDIRTVGGQIVVAPSSIDGRTYQWINWGTPIAEIPLTWVTALTATKRDASTSPINGDLIPEGMRNDTLFRKATALRSVGCIEGEIAGTLMSVNQRLCDPPLDDREIATIVRSAMKCDPVPEPWDVFRNPGQIPPGASPVPLCIGQRDDLGFIRVKELLAKPVPIPQLIYGILEMGALAQLFGKSGCGKSFAAIDWACHVATGTDWCGRKVAQGPVFYIAGEGHSGIRKRLKVWEQHHLTSLADAPLFVSNAPASLMDAANAANVARAVETLAAGHGAPMMIIVDTLARNLGAGEENSNADVGKFINNMDIHLRGRFGATVLIVHHTGHGEQDRSRGASSLRAAMDHEYRLEDKSGIRELTCTKAKESEPPSPMTFRLQPIVLDGWKDSSGEFITSAVLVPTNEKPTFRQTELRGANRIAFLALCNAVGAAGTPPETDLAKEFGDRVPVKVVSEEVWRQRAYDEGISDGEQDAKKKAFSRARKTLLDLRLIATWKDYYWPIGPIPGHGTVPGHVGTLSLGKGDETGHTSIDVSRCPPINPMVHRY